MQKIWQIFELGEKNNDFKLEKIQFLPATAPNAKEPLICRACCAAGGICKPVPVKKKTGLKVLTMLRAEKPIFLGDYYKSCFTKLNFKQHMLLELQQNLF